MPFFLYRKTLRANEWEYHDPEHVVLGGKGLIQSACRKYLASQDCGWTISAAELLLAGGHEPTKHALVIDTAPKRESVSLFEIKSIAGYSYATWTPIMLVFEQLFVDAEDELIIDDNPPLSPDVFKKRFLDGRCERHIVRSILYLNGGFEAGSWNWGGNSRTTAALLWEDAWNHFISVQVT